MTLNWQRGMTSADALLFWSLICTTFFIMGIFALQVWGEDGDAVAQETIAMINSQEEGNRKVEFALADDVVVDQKISDGLAVVSIGFGDAYSCIEALNQIIRGSGTQFDLVRGVSINLKDGDLKASQSVGSLYKKIRPLCEEAASINHSVMLAYRPSTLIPTADRYDTKSES